MDEDIDDAAAEETAVAVKHEGDDVIDNFDPELDVMKLLEVKYGYEHLMKHAPGAHLSLNIGDAGTEFRSFEDVMKPRILVTDQLRREFDNGAPGSANALILLDAQVAERVEPELDIGVGSFDLAPRGARFFQIVLGRPNQVKGQEACTAINWRKNEFLVLEKQVAHVVRASREIFVWTESIDQRQDFSLSAPTDNFIHKTLRWVVDKEKYFWNASWKFNTEAVSSLRDALDVVKMLKDIDAYPSRGKSLSLDPGIATKQIAALRDLERVGVVEQLGSNASASTWRFLANVRLEPISRLHMPAKFIEAIPDTPLASASILDLVAKLVEGGWKHKWWMKKSKKSLLPPPVQKATGKPQLFYTKPAKTAEAITVSRQYLLVLLSLEDVKEDEVQHLQSDEYYRCLLGKGGRRKQRKQLSPMESSLGLEDLTIDDAPKRKKQRVSSTLAIADVEGDSKSKSAKPKKTISRHKHERSHAWGAALITICQKSDGTTVVQGSCHRKCSHRNRGKTSSSCRKTYTVSGDLSEAQCIICVKQWIVNAVDFSSRLAHRRHHPLPDQCSDPADLEILKPPADYSSDVEVEQPGQASSSGQRGGGCRGRTGRGHGPRGHRGRGGRRGGRLGRGRASDDAISKKSDSTDSSDSDSSSSSSSKPSASKKSQNESSSSSDS
jgi:hypothetical protein